MRIAEEQNYTVSGVAMTVRCCLIFAILREFEAVSSVLVTVVNYHSFPIFRFAEFSRTEIARSHFFTQTRKVQLI